MTCLKNIVSYVLKDEYVRLSGLIETVLPCTTPEIFTLRTKYTIVEAINDSYGKWPNQLGNGWFTDSQFIVDDLIDMIVEAVPAVFEKQNLSGELSETIKELGNILKTKNLGKFTKQYAMLIAGKLARREDEYVYYAGESVMGRGKLRLMEVVSDFIAYLQKHENIYKAAPFIDTLEKMETADF